MTKWRTLEGEAIWKAWYDEQMSSGDALDPNLLERCPADASAYGGVCRRVVV